MSWIFYHCANRPFWFVLFTKVQTAVRFKHKNSELLVDWKIERKNEREGEREKERKNK